MNRLEHHLEEHLNDFHTVRLPDEARARIRAELLSYAELHAVAAEAPTLIRSPFSILWSRAYAGLAAFVLVLGTLGGTAYASENALPGDALYGIKVRVSEPIQTALIPDAKGKAAWHAILAERRLEEAVTLAARGSLSTDAQKEIATNLNAHVEASEETAEQLEQKGDPVASLAVRSDLEARLSAHQRILSVIAAHYAESADGQLNRTAIERMLATISGHEQTVVSSRIALEDAIAPSAPVTKKAPPAMAKSAKIAITPAAEPSAMTMAADTGTMQVRTAAALRSEEEQSILSRHADLLAKFAPTASTTASTTASMATTTEATTTPETEINSK